MNTNLKSRSEFQMALGEIVAEFANALDGVTPDYHVKNRPDGDFLVFEFASPHPRFYRIVDEIESSLPESHPLKGRCAISARAKKPDLVLNMPETQLLQKAISESLTVDRHSFGEDFFARYTPSVTNFEQQIGSSANFIVFGRRGAGKSSLLAYAMHKLSEKGRSFAWVAMQTYESRRDDQVIPSVLADVLMEAKQFSAQPSEFEAIVNALVDLAESDDRTVYVKVERMLPRIRKILGTVATSKSPFTVFLDDFHVVHESLQPKLLSAIYSVTRGNNAYIKLSGVQQFTRAWDGTTRQGLQAPHDAQILTLDYNLTMPDKSKKHIVSILDSHAKFCGLPSVLYLTSDDVLSRIVLEAAAVPRDSLSLFTQGITKASIRGQKTISIMSVNAAASEMAEGKLRDIPRDTGENQEELLKVLERVKQFCITEQRTNSFLMKISNGDDTFEYVQKLIALRLIHILHEGITPHEAGQRYVALMLDYGFYIGIRAAKSVVLFPTEPKTLLAKELRKLPIFR